MPVAKIGRNVGRSLDYLAALLAGPLFAQLRQPLALPEEIDHASRRYTEAAAAAASEGSVSRSSRGMIRYDAIRCEGASRESKTLEKGAT